MTDLLSAAVGLAVSAATLALLLATGWAWKIALDRPNARSLHVRPTPRCGGVGIIPVVAALCACLPGMRILALGAGLLAVLSLIDDRNPLSARIRLLIQAVVVICSLILTLSGVPYWIDVVVAVAWLWVINLFNFMDGADGLAGSMAAIGFATLAWISQGQAPQVALISAAIAGASAGFLIFNLPPARLFMGDVGSIPLGYFAAALAFIGWRAGAWSLAIPIVVFSPFLMDTTVTLLRRLARGEKVWQAHREHYYQRVVEMGASHGQMTARWILAMLGCAGWALWMSSSHSVWSDWRWSVPLVIEALIGVAIDVRYNHYKKRLVSPQ